MTLCGKSEIAAGALGTEAGRGGYRASTQASSGSVEALMSPPPSKCFPDRPMLLDSRIRSKRPSIIIENSYKTQRIWTSLKLRPSLHRYENPSCRLGVNTANYVDDTSKPGATNPRVNSESGRRGGISRKLGRQRQRVRGFRHRG